MHHKVPDPVCFKLWHRQQPETVHLSVTSKHSRSFLLRDYFGRFAHQFGGLPCKIYLHGENNFYACLIAFAA